MKRSWTTILLIVGSVGLLALIAGLQYRWLSQISESDSEKAQKRVQEQADRFAMDFNREIQNAYFNFQTDAESWKRQDWGPFNERYEFWREKTSYPGLISGFYFFDKDAESTIMRYDNTSRSFVPTEITAELAELKARSLDEKNFKPVYDDVYTLVLPIHQAGHKVEHVLIRTRTAVPDSPMPIGLPEKYGFLAIKLDPSTINEKLLPDLANKYFGEGDFRAAVVDKNGQPVYQAIGGETIDATASLFNMSPDNFMFFANKELMSSIGGERRESVVLNSRVESRTYDATINDPGESKAVKIELKKEAAPRTAIFTATTAAGNNPWTLQVQHVSGSLAAYTQNTLRRNLAIGFGLLFLLAAAIGAIIISSQRAKMLAQRQMDFVSSVSHEFRTPLAVIYSAGENLADGVAKKDEQVAKYGDLIKGEGRKLTAMVEQILDFAGANSGRKKYNLALTSVSDVVEYALGECRLLFDEKGIKVESNIPDHLPPINVDQAALSQAIQNLVTNSVKYGNGEHWVGINATNGDGKIKISVEDRGLGITKGDLKQIFEPFYRSKEVVDAQIHGNGLGLSLVSQIVRAHGGNVSVSSEVGKGSKFTIELPQVVDKV